MTSWSPRSPDADDRHVQAAGLGAGARAVITFNLDDFPGDKLAPYNVESKHADEFVPDAIDLCARARDNPGHRAGDEQEPMQRLLLAN